MDAPKREFVFRCHVVRECHAAPDARPVSPAPAVAELVAPPPPPTSVSPKGWS